LNPDEQPVATLQTPPAEGECLAFSYRDEYGILADGFVFRRGAQLFAYRNQCRHQPLTLDYGDGDVFTEGRDYLLCRNHGALFAPETGLCIAGPCTGASLFPLKTVESGRNLHIYLQPESSCVELE
jgi:nitrite reductase/ring-hydroxylating ferredoxin subunit